MERRFSQENYVELLDTGQFLVAEEMFAERRTDDPMEMVIRSEVALYFGRLEESASLLDQVMKRISDVDVAARFSLAKGRLALVNDNDDEAQTLLQSAYYFYSFAGDDAGIGQSLLELSKLARRKADFEAASVKLGQARVHNEGRASKKAEFFRGLLASEQAALDVERGELDGAARNYEEAIRILKGAEKGRHYAYTLVGLADLRYMLGEFQESQEFYKEANTVFERYDLRNDQAEGQLRLATALIRLNKLERAEKLLTDSRNLVRNNPAGESLLLSQLSCLALLQNDPEKAAEHAAKAIELADQSGSAEARARARTALGQVHLHTHEFREATEVLREATEITRYARASMRIRRAELEASIYLAEAYHHVDTRAGRMELTRANDILNTLEDAWLGDEFNRVSAKYEEQILFTDDNRLVFDGNQLPRWHDAKRTLEGFLLRNALRQTNNSLTRAARKLGVSKVHVHNLKKKHNM